MSKGSPALQAFLVQYDSFNRAYLIDITLTSGVVIGMIFGTNLTVIPYNSINYYSTLYGTWEMGANNFEADFRPKTNSFNLMATFHTAVTGVSPDAPINYYPSTPANQVTMLQAINGGIFSGASVHVQVLYWPIGATPTTSFNLPANGAWAGGSVTGISMGTIPLNVGQIGNVIKTGRSKVTFEVYDLIYLLNRPLPPNQIQSSCRHTLFDAGCTLLASNFTSTNISLDSTSTSLYLNLTIAARLNSHAYVKGNLIEVASIVYMCTTAGTSAGSAPSFTDTRGVVTSDGATLKWTSMNGAYPQGWGTFTSGLNAGVKFPIKVMTTSGTLTQLQLSRPLPFGVNIDNTDTVTLVPGCDKSITTCNDIYNNLVHFGGMPFVPNPETAYLGVNPYVVLFVMYMVEKSILTALPVLIRWGHKLWVMCGAS